MKLRKSHKPRTNQFSIILVAVYKLLFHAVSCCKNFSRGYDRSSAKNPSRVSPQSHLHTKIKLIVKIYYLTFWPFYSQKTHDKRPGIRDGFGSTDNADCWGLTLRWWFRSDTTGNILLSRFGRGCGDMIVTREAARQLVERVRPERKVWLLLGIEVHHVGIGCIHHRDRCTISEMASCKTSRRLYNPVAWFQKVVNCIKLIIDILCNKRLARQPHPSFFSFNSLEIDRKTIIFTISPVGYDQLNF